MHVNKQACSESGEKYVCSDTCLSLFAEKSHLTACGKPRNMLPLHQRGLDRITPTPFQNKSLLEKLKDSYYERDHDPNVSRLADKVATTYFWFIGLTEIYVSTEYLIPYHFDEYDPMTRYYIKVLCWFVFLNAAANWTATRFYQSFHSRTKDRPDISKSLWDDHPGPDSRQTMTNGVPQNGYGFKEHDTAAWEWCQKCGLYKPPRCHHCLICDKCVLKRDHHCYMSGVCVGFYNQRFFIMMNFYIALGSFVGLYYIWGYMCDTVFILFDSNTEYLLHVAIYNCVWTRRIAWYQLFMMFHIYTLWWTGFTGLGFFSWQMFCIVLGKTSNEIRKNKSHIRSTNSISANFRSVFGAFWGLNFLFPANIIFRQMGDGKHWDGVKGL